MCVNQDVRFYLHGKIRDAILTSFSAEIETLRKGVKSKFI